MSKEATAVRPRRILLLHLDLGIGGAENLVVQLACSMQDLGHQVTILTSHHDINHCFEETKPSGPLGPHIHVYGDFLPRHFMGKFTVFFAILRMIVLALVVGLFMNDFDLVFIDGVAAPIPLLRLFGQKVMYYCHFPDLLLCTDRSSRMKRFYRFFMDWLEMVSTAQASTILVNSGFTATVFKDTFPSVYHSNTPKVLYPTVSVVSVAEKDAQRLPYLEGYDHVFFSLNRYERKKRIDIAIDAFAHFKRHHSVAQPHSSSVLVIAGGYDMRVAENVEVLCELREHCTGAGLTALFLPPDVDLHALPRVSPDVIFRVSISSSERLALFATCKALLYTPDREHFGIVPIEAMMQETPVIAVNSGGPTESVADGETGFLCDQRGDAFGDAMLRLISEDSGGMRLHDAMGRRARRRVIEKFSDVAMREQLTKYIEEVARA